MGSVNISGMSWHECPECGKMFYKNSDECPYCARKEMEKESEQKTEKVHTKNQSTVEHVSHKSKKILCPECRRRFDRKYDKCPFCAKKKKAKSSKAIEKPKTYSKSISLDFNAKKILSEICNLNDEGYKFIVLEANERNSDIAVELAKEYKSSIILAANKKAEMRYNKEYQLRKLSKINLTNQKDLFNNKNIEKSEILIIDDAHRLDENIVNLFSVDIDLLIYPELKDSLDFKIEDLPNKDHYFWINLLNHKSLDYENTKRVVECIEQNPENWICSYDSDYNRLSFYPLNIGNLAKEYWFSKGEICIFISSSVLNFELFTHELGLDSSEVKFIPHDWPVDLDKNKIYARKTVDMNESNSYLIDLIREILDKHKNEKGLILRNRKRLSIKKIDDERLLLYKTANKKLKEFNESSNSVIFTNSLEDGMDFPYDQCRFQIIVRQPYYPYNKRSKVKQEESQWYSYKQIINLMQQLQRPITSKEDYCITYILDEDIVKSINYDVLHNGFIPNGILDLIVDMDMEKGGLVCENIKKQFGVYHLFDYFPYIKEEDDEKLWNDKNRLLHYKDYDKDEPDIYLDEFNSFTKEFMKAISKLSNEIIDEKFNKLALVCVPSSTPKRNESATVRESIKQIEKWYEDGRAQSEFNCQKEIINCGDLLKRVEDVPTSHKSEKRANYLQHMNSIECEKKDILEMNDVAFIIMDDVSTRGTVLNACEDILINNGVKKENIYKLVLFKTVW